MPRPPTAGWSAPIRPRRYLRLSPTHCSLPRAASECSHRPLPTFPSLAGIFLIPGLVSPHPADPAYSGFILLFYAFLRPPLIHYPYRCASFYRHRPLPTFFFLGRDLKSRPCFLILSLSCFPALYASLSRIAPFAGPHRPLLSPTPYFPFLGRDFSNPGPGLRPSRRSRLVGFSSVVLRLSTPSSHSLPLAPPSTDHCYRPLSASIALFQILSS